MVGNALETLNAPFLIGVQTKWPDGKKQAANDEMGIVWCFNEGIFKLIFTQLPKLQTQTLWLTYLMKSQTLVNQKHCSKVFGNPKNQPGVCGTLTWPDLWSAMPSEPLRQPNRKGYRQILVSRQGVGHYASKSNTVRGYLPLTSLTVEFEQEVWRILSYMYLYLFSGHFYAQQASIKTLRAVLVERLFNSKEQACWLSFNYN